MKCPSVSFILILKHFVKLQVVLSCGNRHESYSVLVLKDLTAIWKTGGKIFSKCILLELRTCYPKMWYLGIWNTLSWRNLRNGMYRMDFLTCLLSKSKNPNERYLPLPRGKDYPYIWRRREGIQRVIWGTGSFSTLSSYSLCC